MRMVAGGCWPAAGDFNTSGVDGSHPAGTVALSAGASAVPAGTDTPDASRMEAWRSPTAGLLPAAWNGSAVVTRAAHGAGATSRPDAGRVRPPPRRRVGREEASASVSSCGGGRGGGRDVVSLIAWHSAWLSQATRTVDLRSPLYRLSIAVAGDLPANARRLLTSHSFSRKTCRPGPFDLRF